MGNQTNKVNINFSIPPDTIKERADTHSALYIWCAMDSFTDIDEDVKTKLTSGNNTFLIQRFVVYNNDFGVCVFDEEIKYLFTIISSRRIEDQEIDLLISALKEKDKLLKDSLSILF